MKDYVLEIRDLNVNFKKKSNIFSRGKDGIICAVAHVDLNIGRNEVHGLVGVHLEEVLSDYHRYLREGSSFIQKQEKRSI